MGTSNITGMVGGIASKDISTGTQSRSKGNYDYHVVKKGPTD
jgi:hypothetical protein